MKRRKSSHTGVLRVAYAFKHSLDGLTYAIINESAFRSNLILIFILMITSLVIGKNLDRFFYLIITSVILLIAELINTAFEVVCDKITADSCEYIKTIKDLASASVFLSLTLVIAVWIYVIW